MWYQNRGFWPDATERPGGLGKKLGFSPMSSRGRASWSRMAFVYRFVLYMPDLPVGLEKDHVRNTRWF